MRLALLIAPTPRGSYLIYRQRNDNRMQAQDQITHTTGISLFLAGKKPSRGKRAAEPHAH
jgi:hypothetical protein